MNQTIAANIRRHRDRLAWTQRQLADAAKVTERTVQRAEDAQGLSAETLQAIAGAINVPLDDLRRDVVADQVKATVDKYKVVQLEVLEHSSQFQNLLARADALYFDCIVRDDAAQDEAAEFHQDLRDCIDIWSDIDELGRRDSAKSLFAHVEALSAQGLVATAGLDQLRLRPKEGGSAFNMTTLYVVVSTKDEPKRFVTRDKTADIQFT
jgi:transcriptional regulator with XRE-family HTH domain